MEACSLHPDRPQVALCMACLRPACGACLDEAAGSDLCRPCASRRRRQLVARWRAAAIGTGASLAALGLAAWVAAGYVQTHVVEGPLHQQEAALSASPCGRDAILGLLEEEMKLGNPRAAVDDAATFEQRCGPFRKLARFTYGAHMQLHEYDRAAAAATALIEDNPEDKDYRWWRGQAFEESGALERAAADYQYAISIQPRLARVPMNLATVYEKLHRPCDALFTIEQYAQRYPRIRGEDAVTKRLKRLDDQGGCRRIAGAGRALVRFTPGERAILVTVRLDDRIDARFVVDTGATMVAITRPLASSLGIARSEADAVVVGTAGGLRTAQLATLASVEVQGAVAERVGAAVADELPPGVDGLLGMSFLSRFTMFLDEAQGTLELAARDGAAARKAKHARLAGAKKKRGGHGGSRSIGKRARAGGKRAR